MSNRYMALWWAVTLGSLGTTAAYAQRMYWTEVQSGGNGQIERADLNGSNRETVLQLPGLSATDVAVDVEGGKMYWGEVNSRLLRRANLDGSGAETLVALSGFLKPGDLELDLQSGKVYWTEFDEGTGGSIRRANLDGSALDTVIPLSAALYAAIALDVDGGKIYYSEVYNDTILRADLDGANGEVLVDFAAAAGGIFDIALDVANGKMYWTNGISDSVQRANMEIPGGDTPSTRSDIEDLLTSGISSPHSLELDLLRGYMYFTDGGLSTIVRARPDGSNMTVLVQGPPTPGGLALDTRRTPATEVPTVSSWGVMVMTLLLATAGTLTIRLQIRVCQ